MTGSAGGAAHSDGSSTDPRPRGPGVFKTAVVLLGLSAFAYGLVEFWSQGRPAFLFMPANMPVVAVMYGAAVIWIVGGGRRARKNMLFTSVVLCIGQVTWAHGAEGLISYLVALITSAAGMVLLYMPKSTSHIAARESYMTKQRVRRLFEERGKSGERMYGVSEIATFLGMSTMTAYQHLDPDQQQRLRRSSDDG